MKTPVADKQQETTDKDIVVLGQKNDHYDDGFHFPDQLPKPIEQTLDKIYDLAHSDKVLEGIVITSLIMVGVAGAAVSAIGIAAGIVILGSYGLTRLGMKCDPLLIFL